MSTIIGPFYYLKSNPKPGKNLGGKSMEHIWQNGAEINTVPSWTWFVLGDECYLFGVCLFTFSSMPEVCCLTGYSAK